MKTYMHMWIGKVAEKNSNNQENQQKHYISGRDLESSKKIFIEAFSYLVSFGSRRMRKYCRQN